MDSRELAEWRAFVELEPWGIDLALRERRADLRVGMLTARVVNLTAAKGAAPAQPEDFVVQYGKKVPETPKQAAERLLASARMINAMLGGDDKTKRKK